MLSDAVQHSCVCQGVSAGCTVKLCHYPAPPLDTMAMHLKKLYDTQDCKVHSNHQSGANSKLISACTMEAPATNELIFLQRSTNFCYPSELSPGVSGRECEDRDDSEPGSCNHLCCGRGHVTTTVREETEGCTFVWCCRVECRTLYSESKKHHCK